MFKFDLGEAVKKTKTNKLLEFYSGMDVLRLAIPRVRLCTPGMDM